MLLLTRALLLGGCCGAARAIAQLVDTSGQHVYDGAKTTVDRPLSELLEIVPELRGLEPAESQDELDEILGKVGANVEALLEGFPNLVAREDISQERLDRRRSVTTRRLDPFSYMILAHESSEKVDLDEYRIDAKGNRAEPQQLERKFCLTKGFATMWIHFHPGNRPASRFKLLGQQELRGHKADVVAFAQRPGWATVVGKVDSNGKSIIILYQGIAWIDVPSYQILRMRTDLLTPREDVGLKRQTSEIEFGEVRLSGVSTPLWLPHEVVVTTESNGEILHNRHRYTDYRLFRVESTIKPVESVAFAGGKAQSVQTRETTDNTSALQLQPGGTEAQSVQAKETTDNAAALQSQSGGTEAQSVRAKETTDNAAVPQLQPGAQSPGIHIEVRQVLVPVVVTDSKGHSVLGLRPSQFKVFEDGVEQKVLSLTSEADGAAKLFEPQPALPPPGAEAINPSRQEIGRPDRVYLVVIDTLNSEFGNFAQIRGALKKLFSEAQPDSARYALVALAQNTSVVQPFTRDPSAAVRALENKQFTKSILASEQSSRAQQETQLRRMLEDYCQKCPCADGKCSTGPALKEIESFATSAGEEHASQLRSFLQQLRGLVEQLGTVSGKRTIILISDGFTIQPGRDLFELIAIYLQDPGIVLQDPIARMDPELDAVLRLADDYNVIFYTLDSRGVYVVPTGGFDITGPPMSSKTPPRVMPQVQSQETAAAVEKDDGLQELAEATGGLSLGDSNNALNGMRRAFADGRAYYVIAYTSSNPAAGGKFRKIQVLVDEKKLRIRAKQGYWAPVQ